MKIKEFFKDYREDILLLDSFKTSVINSFDLGITLKKQEYEFDYSHHNFSNEPYYPADFEWNFNEILPTKVLEMMNSLGESLDRFSLSTKQDEYTNELYSTFNFDEVWNYIKSQSSYDFLIAMVSFSLIKNEYNKNQIHTKFLEEIVISQLKEHSIEFYKLKKEQIFIALAFNENMKSARESIHSAVESAGYNAMFIDLKEHNNLIVPEIFFEIEKSVIVIADLTGHRASVYLEAGYALAKNIPVILSCREDDFKNRHFDVSQINTIQWKDELDLEKRLISRIKSSLKIEN
ncbi:hypothetical protein ACHFI2_08880 [Exiguobacterium acetylicum]|uniref:hypothetical protein n=1 Tax=Exiguobacterium acetylicum TaxID=41170 RepID=UPI0038766212